jgi:hypothetical protein
MYTLLPGAAAQAQFSIIERSTCPARPITGICRKGGRCAVTGASALSMKAALERLRVSQSVIVIPCGPPYWLMLCFPLHEPQRHSFGTTRKSPNHKPSRRVGDPQPAGFDCQESPIRLVSNLRLAQLVLHSALSNSGLVVRTFMV